LSQLKRLDALDGEPIPVRAVDISLNLEEFVTLFKRFDIMFTRRGLELEGREYSIIED
jgi:hypothetical protein